MGASQYYYNSSYTPRLLLKMASGAKQHLNSSNCLEAVAGFGNRGKDGDTQLFVNHQSQNTHHGGTALVKFNGSLAEFGGFIESVPAKVKVVVTKIAGEFATNKVTHYENFKGTDQGKDLEVSGVRDGFNGSVSTGDIGELSSRKVNASRESDSGFGDKVSDNGDHGDTSVLDFGKSEAVEFGLVGIGDKAQRIPEAQRQHGTKVIFKGLEGALGRSLLGGDERFGGGKSKGKDGGGLHDEFDEWMVKKEKFLFGSLCNGRRWTKLKILDR